MAKVLNVDLNNVKEVKSKILKMIDEGCVKPFEILENVNNADLSIEEYSYLMVQVGFAMGFIKGYNDEIALLN